jgi:ATP-dependent DNA helicase RecG
MNQKQVAMMVPTALLAEQHYQVIHAWLEPLGVEVFLLTGSLCAANRREIVEKLVSGTPCIVIGTHALFQQDIHFHSLSLVVIDEQHRFGVNQRFSLSQKGVYPHQLMMSATPIPRTLAMNLYADLDCSIIDELPKGRKPIKTIALANNKRLDVMSRMMEICAKGQQVYWVCPLIEESELLQCQAAESSYALLVEQLPMLRIGIVHGRMSADEKERMMRDFKEKKHKYWLQPR